MESRKAPKDRDAQSREPVKDDALLDGTGNQAETGKDQQTGEHSRDTRDRVRANPSQIEPAADAERSEAAAAPRATNPAKGFPENSGAR